MPDIDWHQVSAVFSDVDETLIRDKSMFSFLDQYGAATGLLDAAAVRGQLQELAAHGGTRDDVNRHYYASFAGHNLDTLISLGREWFTSRTAWPGYWISDTCAIVENAVAHDVPVILVSGSHRACLEPLAMELGVGHLLCTELEVDSTGILTGTRTQTAIGAKKLHRVMEFAGEHGIHLAHAIAMGDHDSDLAFMEAIGRPIAVNPAPGLRRRAVHSGWTLLSPV
jgi:HAD superfamily hydrolase (TIGR01490 family)